MEQRRSGLVASHAPLAATALRYGIAVLSLTLVVMVAALVGPLTLQERTATSAPAPMTIDIPPAPVLEIPDAAPGWDVDLSWMWWVVAVLGALITIAILWHFARMIHRKVRLSAGQSVVLPPLLTLASVGLTESAAEVDLTDGRLFDAARSADDIIASWTALERAAASVGLPRAASATPTEFLEVLGAAVLGAAVREAAVPEAADLRGDAATLLDAYHRARFDTAALAPGVATAARRAASAWVRACAAIESVGAVAVGHGNGTGE